jgi:hypothetical protein
LAGAESGISGVYQVAGHHAKGPIDKPFSGSHAIDSAATMGLRQATGVAA